MPNYPSIGITYGKLMRLIFNNWKFRHANMPYLDQKRHFTPLSLTKQDQDYSGFFLFFFLWKVPKRQLPLKKINSSVQYGLAITVQRLIISRFMFSWITFGAFTVKPFLNSAWLVFLNRLSSQNQTKSTDNERQN